MTISSNKAKDDLARAVSSSLDRVTSNRPATTQAPAPSIPPATAPSEPSPELATTERVLKKGITIRQSHLDKLEEAEMYLRKYKIRANTSSLLQAAVELLVVDERLVEAHRRIEKLDSRK